VRRVIGALFAALFPATASAIGLEIQGYPAGVIADVSHVVPVGDRGSVAALGGWNFTDRGDFGEHADEHGGGPGLGVAAWRWFGADQTGWGLGARADLWWLEIEWEDAGRRGETDVLVLQPTARAGYAWRLGNEAMRVEASLSLGAEINVSTTGEDVGEGAILLLGVAVSR